MPCQIWKAFPLRYTMLARCYKAIAMAAWGPAKDVGCFMQVNLGGNGMQAARFLRMEVRSFQLQTDTPREVFAYRLS